MIEQKAKQRYLQINPIFRLTTKPSSENVVKYIYSNKYSNVATQYQ